MNKRQLMIDASRFRNKKEKCTFVRDMLLTLAAVVSILLIRSI